MRLPRLGTWFNAVHHDRFGVILFAGNVRTEAEMKQHRAHATLRATAEGASGLIGARMVLLGCDDPAAEHFLSVMETAEAELGLPPGARLRRSPAQRYSYLSADYPTSQTIDGHTAWAKRAGMKMVLFSYMAFSRGAGHFQWNEAFAGGMADLKKMTDAIRAAGLLVGLHLRNGACSATSRRPKSILSRPLTPSGSGKITRPNAG